MRKVGGVSLDLSTNKIDRHDKTEILLKMELNTITITLLYLPPCHDKIYNQQNKILTNFFNPSR
jgi:hypothetical protein